ncbi:MAG: hypothetical protein AAF656_09245, partial [Planctomycetota bacterium]
VAGDPVDMSNAPSLWGYVAAGFLVTIAMSVALGAQGYLHLANIAADQLLDAESYVTAVLGEDGWAYVEQRRAEVTP